MRGAFSTADTSPAGIACTLLAYPRAAGLEPARQWPGSRAIMGATLQQQDSKMTARQQDPAEQAARLRAAVDQAVVVGRDFVRGAVDADHMAHAMTQAVSNYVAREQAAGRDLKPQDAATMQLTEALAELKTCGSGYLAGRCDAA